MREFKKIRRFSYGNVAPGIPYTVDQSCWDSFQMSATEIFVGWVECPQHSIGRKNHEMTWESVYRGEQKRTQHRALCWTSQCGSLPPSQLGIQSTWKNMDWASLGTGMFTSTVGLLINLWSFHPWVAYVTWSCKLSHSGPCGDGLLVLTSKTVLTEVRVSIRCKH